MTGFFGDAVIDGNLVAAVGNDYGRGIRAAQAIMSGRVFALNITCLLYTSDAADE